MEGATTYFMGFFLPKKASHQPRGGALIEVMAGVVIVLVPVLVIVLVTVLVIVLVMVFH